jgi:hypothetical protein
MKENDPNSRIRANIDQYGWHCLNVWPRVGDDEHTAFSYTIGLTESYGHPEIMIFGLGDKAHGILNECANLIKKGARFVPNDPNPDVLTGDYRVIFRPVRKECFPEYLGTALRYYGKRPFEAFVLFWPNKEHKYPWEYPERNLQAEALNVV